MAFKIKDGVRIGTTDVFNNSGQLLAPTILGTITVATSGALTNDGFKISPRAGGTGTYRIEFLPGTLTANRTLTFPDATGTVALTSDIPTVNNGTFAVSVSGTAATSGTALSWGTSSGFSANTASNSTYDLRVGPALSALATLMSTAGAGFIKRGATADTYTIDTSTYLTAESDTLQTVTGRGATSNAATISLTGNTASSSTGTGTLVVTGGVGISGVLNVGGAAAVGGNLTVTGDLTVNGTTTTVNSTTVTVDDKNLELGSVASPTNTTADGGGITLKGATDKTFNWVNATSAWTSSEHLAVASGKNILISGSTSGTVTLAVPAAAGTGTITFPASTGTVALTSDIKDSTLTLSIGSAAATNNTVTVATGTGFSTNVATNQTYQLSIGPALTNLASTMTGAGTGFLKKTGADTYSVDTTTYLGATTTSNIELQGSTLIFADSSGNDKVFKTGFQSVAITANTATSIDTWALGTYRSAKYLITVRQGTKYQSSELLVVHDGVTTYLTEYAVVETNSASPIPITLSTAIVSTNVVLSATVTDAATTNAVLVLDRTLMLAA